MGRQNRVILPRWLTTSLVIAFAGYLVFSLIMCQVSIASKRQELATVQEQLDVQMAKNEELSRELSGDESEIIERAARDELGYAKPNERVFVDMSGK